MQYLTAFCSRTETASDVISSSFVGPIVPDKLVKFRGLPNYLKSFSRNSTRSRWGRHFRRSFRDNFGPEAVCDAISGMDVEQVGMDICQTFGDSRSRQSGAGESAAIMPFG